MSSTEILRGNRGRFVAALALALSTFAIVGSSPAGAAGGLSTGSAGSLNAADGNLVRVNKTQGFSPDGTLDAGSAGTTDLVDWASTTACTGSVVVGCRQTGTDDTRSQTDNSLGQGTKEDSAVPNVTQGSIPNNKSDLSRFYVQSERGTVGSHDATILDLAWERVNTLGSANMDFEFNQSKCYGSTTTGCNSPTSTTSNLNTPSRTAGDVLITFDFANGGNTVNLGLLRWLTSGHSDSVSDCFSNNVLPCWGKRVDLNNYTISGGTHIAQGAVNDGFTVTEPLVSGTPTLAADTFGEASIDLTDVPNLFTPGKCTTLGSAWLKSRSSASFTAEQKDFVAPVKVEVSNCGSATIYKQDTSASPHAALAGTTFTIYKDNAPTGTAFHDPTKIYPVSATATTLNGGINSSIASVTVADDVTGWATAPFYVKVQDEFMRVTNVDGTGKQLTVVRGVLGTTAAGHLDTTAVNYATNGEDSFLTDGGTTITGAGWTNASPTSTGTFTVADVSALPASGTFYAIIDNEVVLASVTDAANKTLTLSGRGLDGTAAVGHTSGANFKLLYTCSPSGSVSSSTSTPPFTGTASTCTITNIPFGRYWVVETAAPSGFTIADPQNTDPGINADNPDESFLFGDAETPTSVNVIKVDDRDGTAAPVSICTTGVSQPCAAFTLYTDAAPLAGTTLGATWHDPTKYYDTAKASTLSIAITDTSTLTVNAAAPTGGWPATPFVVRVDDELMSVSATTATTLTVSRGSNGTTAATHLANAAVTVEQLGEDGTSAGTCAVLGSDANKCTFQSVLPGYYWAVETGVPTGYSKAAPQSFNYTAGGTTPSDLTFVDHRLFKVLVFVCTESDNSLAQAKVTLGGTTRDSATTLTGVTASTLCAMKPGSGSSDSGGAVFPDLQKDNGTTPSSSGYTTHAGDVHIGYAAP